MEGEFHAPSIGEFFPGESANEFIWEDTITGGWFSLDRIMLVRLLVAAIMITFFVVAMRKPKIIPSGLQNVAEIMLDFVRIHIAEEILGKKEGRRFLAVLVPTFFLVLFLNSSSVIPFLNISSNARAGMPLILALFGYIAFIYAGVKRYGFFKYMKSSVVIPNLPIALHLLVIPLEFLSTFILRPATLTIRLLSNMLVGHIILVLLFSATNLFFWQLNGWTALSAVTLAAGIAFTLFECLVISSKRIFLPCWWPCISIYRCMRTNTNLKNSHTHRP